MKFQKGTNVIDVCSRLAEARRRREVANRAAFAALVSNIPEPVLVAILEAVRDKRPDAIMRLRSFSWRKRTLAAWRAVGARAVSADSGRECPFPKEQP